MVLMPTDFQSVRNNMLLALCQLGLLSDLDLRGQELRELVTGYSQKQVDGVSM
jgi:hypothetical protein